MQPGKRKRLGEKPARGATQPPRKIEKNKANKKKVTVAAKKNPFKTTYILDMRIGFNSMLGTKSSKKPAWVNSKRRVEIDPSTCIGPNSAILNYQAIGNPENDFPLDYEGIYLFDTSNWEKFGLDWEDEMDERGIRVYLGSHPFASNGAEMLEGVDNARHKHDKIVQKILNMKNDTLVIHYQIWSGLTPATREAVLRDSRAKEVYICMFWLD